MGFVSRTKQRVVHRYIVDSVYHSSRDYLMFVYMRADGTEYINQRHPRSVVRIDGRPTVEMHSKTVRSVNLVDWLGELAAKMKSPEPG